MLDSSSVYGLQACRGSWNVMPACSDACQGRATCLPICPRARLPAHPADLPLRGCLPASPAAIPPWDSTPPCYVGVADPYAAQRDGISFARLLRNDRAAVTNLASHRVGLLIEKLAYGNSQ